MPLAVATKMFNVHVLTVIIKHWVTAMHFCRSGRNIHIIYLSKSSNTTLSKHTLLLFYYWLINIDALICQQYLNVEAGQGGDNSNYFIDFKLVKSIAIIL